MNTRAPDTLEPADTWRDRSICHHATDSDRWFPAPSDTKANRAAKEECLRCPVLHTCATHALNRREEFGVWGALSEYDRRRILRQHPATTLNNPHSLNSIVDQAIDDAHDSITGPSLRRAYEQRTERVDGGHTRWTVKNNAVSIQGGVYTPMQLAFVIEHGVRPEGTVRATCGFAGCVTGSHLADARMRRLETVPRTPARSGGRPLAPCGTPSAYDRHKRLGEPVDEACREAHNSKVRLQKAKARNQRRQLAASSIQAAA